VNPARTLLAMTVVSLAFSGCAAKESASEQKPETAGAKTVTVTATDTACSTSAGGGRHRDDDLLGHQQRDQGHRVLRLRQGQPGVGQVENISPGLQRQLTVDFPEPGSYRLSCKPGMVGDGISTDFTVKASTSQ